MSLWQLPIFVYGTLKRGEVRAHCWPHRPVTIDWATIRAELRDLGEYPAIIAGNDLVLGELWHVAEQHLATTLMTLDEVEWHRGRDDDEYTRQIVVCRTLAGQQLPAYTYLYAKPETIAHTPRVLPGSNGLCQWTRHSSAQE